MKNSHLISFELSRMKKSLPQLIIGAIVLSIFISAIAFCNKIFFSSKNITPTVKVALVNEDTSNNLNTFLPYVEEMESVSTLITFIPSKDLDSARILLSKGFVSCILYLPSEMMDGILTGNNQPALLYFNKQNTLENKLLEELTTASGKTLSIAQACIYATHDLFVEEELTSKMQETYDSINMINLRYALMRDSLFDEIPAYPSGQLNLSIHYFCSGLLLFLLLYGIPLSGIFEKETQAFMECLNQFGTNMFRLLFAKIITTFTLYMLLFNITILPLYAIFIYSSHTYFKQFILFYFLATLSLFLISLFIALCYTITKNKSAGILTTFLLSIIMLFLSGCFIPSAFLPETLLSIGTILPTTIILTVLEIPFTGNVSFSILISIFIYCIIFLSLLYLVQKKQTKTS